MPVGDVFVGDAGGDVEHDDSALSWELERERGGMEGGPWM